MIDALLVLSYWYAIVHCARGGTLDGVHSGEELATDEFVTTGKNSTTSGWIAKATIRLRLVVYWVKRLAPIA